ncbi:DUF3558 domain-containing protein [Nocardia nova]|uniref:DUF3558 domain-containing protein n=1 Tax=Nocardia nova TaxID=37330 RepID=UPI003400F001
MTSRGKLVRAAVVGAGVVALISACNSGGDSKHGGESAPATSSVAADVPAGFNACQLPQSVIQSESLERSDVDTQDGAGGTKWRGCIWVQSSGNGYSATIDSTNITLPMIRANGDFKVGNELTVSGRPALTYAQPSQDLHTHCIMSIEIKGGGLEISVNNPPSARDTASQHSCDIAQRLAEGIIPSIPSGL